MSERQKSPGAFSILATWILANLLGWTAALVGAVRLAPLGARSPFPWQYDTDVAFVYVSLILLGITVGIAQWIVLRGHLPNASYWIPATMIGYLLSLIIFAIADSDPARLLRSEVVNNLILFGLMGFAIGASQWWVLRKSYERSGLWVFATTFGFLSFMWLVVSPAHPQGEFLVRSVILGALAAVVPGVTLIWMIRQPYTTLTNKTV